MAIEQGGEGRVALLGGEIRSRRAALVDRRGVGAWLGARLGLGLGLGLRLGLELGLGLGLRWGLVKVLVWVN